MNNPLPRSTSLLSQMLAKSTALERVKDIPLATPMHPLAEAKVNKLASAILEAGPETEALLREDKEFNDRVAEEKQLAEINGTRRVDVNGASREADEHAPFVLPSEDSCGLWNPNITLDESQVEAVKTLAKVQYGALIGAAGTGKTTVQKYLLKELIYGKDSTLRVERLKGTQGLNIAMVAFTGMAVQVMKTNLPEWMHVCCKTIHALLEFEPEDTVSSKSGEPVVMFMPQRNRLNKLNIDVLVIDEASMVGLDLWMQLLDALKAGVRIYMTGDLNQMPPIVGQPVFAYALAKWHVCELTKVHRQKEPGANRIVELAHQVLNGETKLNFDTLKGNPDWRVIYQPLEQNPVIAAKQVINILNQLRQRPIDPSDPDSPMLYNPHKDRVMTPGNGYNPNTTASAVQQDPLNERLSYIIEPPSKEHPRFLIDAGMAQKKFSVHNRVMALKNESPATKDRVSNGLAGNIVSIEPNLKYQGNPKAFGDEEEVALYVKQQLLAVATGVPGSVQELSNFELREEDINFDEESPEEEKDKSGSSSHIVTVKFDNGATRIYHTKAGVNSLQLAYCSTVAKCQGSQFDTAIIICHPAEKGQLSREWLYTAITRGVKRVIILGTDYGIRYSISRQRIKGATLAEKILRYQELLAGEAKNAFGGKTRVTIPLTVEEYTGEKIEYNHTMPGVTHAD